MRQKCTKIKEIYKDTTETERNNTLKIQGPMETRAMRKRIGDTESDRVKERKRDSDKHPMDSCV